MIDLLLGGALFVIGVVLLLGAVAALLTFGGVIGVVSYVVGTAVGAFCISLIRGLE